MGICAATHAEKVAARQRKLQELAEKRELQELDSQIESAQRALAAGAQSLARRANDRAELEAADPIAPVATQASAQPTPRDPINIIVRPTNTVVPVTTSTITTTSPLPMIQQTQLTQTKTVYPMPYET